MTSEEEERPRFVMGGYGRQRGQWVKQPAVLSDQYPKRGYLTKFYTGRLRPEFQPLTLLNTILAEKVALLYTFH